MRLAAREVQAVVHVEHEFVEVDSAPGDCGGERGGEEVCDAGFAGADATVDVEASGGGYMVKVFCFSLLLLVGRLC